MVLAVAMVALSGCGRPAAQPPQGQEQPKPELVMGTNAEFAPFEFVNEANEIVGFDVDLAREIADRLGYVLKIDNMAFDGLIPALKTGRIDMIVAAMTITEERLLEVNFSDPYYNAGQVIVVRADNTDINSVEDLKAGRKIAVQLGTTGDLTAQEIAASEENISRFQQISLAFKEVELGRADAVLVDNPVAERFMKTNEGFRIVGDTLTQENFGIAVNKDNPELLGKINRALADIVADGTYDELIGKWFE
jgi:polar amino acid transport system substrate-binding protein